MKRSRQITPAPTPNTDLQDQLTLRRQKIKFLQTQKLRWLDVQGFIDCNLKQHQMLTQQLHQLKQQIQTNAMKLPGNGQLMNLQLALDRERRAFRQKSIRNFKQKIENSQTTVCNEEAIEESTKKIEELSRELSNLQDAQQRYRVVAHRTDFFELYEKLCRECEKLRNQNQQLQLAVGPSVS